MSDARWLDVEDSLRQGMHHLERAVDLHREGGFDGDELGAYRATMAFLHAMQSGYTSLESSFLRLLDLVGEERPIGPDWHAALVARLTIPTNNRPALLDASLARAVGELRRFRHIAAHSYDLFDPARAGPVVEHARLVVRRIPDAVAKLRSAIDRDGPRGVN
jgi:hypothetical protein